MYRPNRIGPFPTLDLDRTAYTPTITSVVAGGVPVFPHVQNTNVNEELENMFGYPGITGGLGANDHCSFGIAMSGAQPESELPVHFTFCGACYWAGAQPITIRPFIARGDSATPVVNVGANNNQCSRPFFLPYESAIVSSLPANEFSSVAFNCSIIAGNILGATLSENPIYLGVQLLSSVAGSTATSIRVSISAHRYLNDIRVFDPTR